MKPTTPPSDTAVPATGFWPATLTTWVDAMAGGDPASRHKALGEMAARYRRPVIRRIRAFSQAISAEDAEDLCQDFFFKKLLAEDGVLQRYDREKGRLRDYLGGALQHFLVSAHRSRKALKRGGGQVHIPLQDWDGGGAAGSDHLDLTFDREWALAIFASAFRELERLCLRKPELASRYAALRPWLLGEASEMRKDELAAELGLSPANFRQVLRRLRLQWRHCVSQIIAPTVASPAEVEDELRYLCEVLRQ